MSPSPKLAWDSKDLPIERTPLALWLSPRRSLMRRSHGGCSSEGHFQVDQLNKYRQRHIRHEDVGFY